MLSIRPKTVSTQRMRYSRFLAAVILGTVALTLAGCPEDRPPGTGPILSVQPANIFVSSNAGTRDLTVRNVGGGTLNWTAQVVSGNAWLSILSGSSGVNDGTITIRFTAHTSPGSRDAFDPREGRVRIASPTSTRDVVVTQDGDTDEYFLGFDDGFAIDEEYIIGFDDSLLTVGFDALYQGGDIPFIDDLSYDAGFYDGIWTAYNDGYFVAYRYAFVIGFSEGYDNAFAGDYLTFLVNDFHTEFANGGFDDGYDDGFSEGRIFGAVDFEANLPFDWLDALLDWESGTDLFFEEINLGTGEFGPVFLYEYGEDPFAKSDSPSRVSPRRSGIVMRRAADAGQPDSDTSATANAKQAIEFARPLAPEQIDDLNVRPQTSLRNNRALRLQTTWLQRINIYNSVFKSALPAATAADSDVQPDSDTPISPRSHTTRMR